MTAYASVIIEELQKILGYPGRMLSGSKSGYSEKHPTHKVVLNGNICTKSHGKIWYGDIDITRDEEKLKAVSAALEDDLFILREMDARFENEAAPRLDRAVAIVTPVEIIYS